MYLVWETCEYNAAPNPYGEMFVFGERETAEKFAQEEYGGYVDFDEIEIGSTLRPESVISTVLTPITRYG
jgi:hypothetical protein